MVRQVILACALFVFCVAANAAEPEAKGFYLGIAGGMSIFDEDGSFDDFGDDEDVSIQLEAGYKFFKHVAVALRYTDWGSFSTGFENIDITATSIHVVGIIPFGTSGWELFGQLGAGNLNIDVADFVDFDENAVGGGIGVRYHPTQNFSIGVQTDVFVWDETSSYTLSVGATQLSVQFIF
jgi:hypothetical protein